MTGGTGAVGAGAAGATLAVSIVLSILHHHAIHITACIITVISDNNALLIT